RLRMRTLLTTQNQNSYHELIMKEAYTRLNWKMKYGKDYPVRFTLPKAKVGNPTTAPKVTLPPVVKAPEKKKKKEEEEVPRLQNVLTAAPLMKPVSPKTRETLYNGLSKEGKGRSQYLKRRVEKMPEERFEYPLLSSWEYGWRLGDYVHDYKSPVNGRSAVIRSTFYARNGIFHIPSATDHL
ncbi:hypothetical protein C0J45_16505, partial [Silurus meridionalis]